jgi:hypothetical protein
MPVGPCIPDWVRGSGLLGSGIFPVERAPRLDLVEKVVTIPVRLSSPEAAPMANARAEMITSPALR